MKLEELLNAYPGKRIKSVDGMAVTAAIWEEAHEYHTQMQRFQTLLYHGNGIASGLKVIASDPADTSVYILPGVAVDPAGRVIVLSQPVAYDIGSELEGSLYLLLSYEESRPRLTAKEAQDGAPLYIQSEFSISVRAALPAAPSVELARLNRRNRSDVFVNAVDPAEPGVNEIDLRYRRELTSFEDASIAVCYLGPEKSPKQGRGVAQLAQELNRYGNCHVAVFDDVPLAPGIEANTLIYLVGQGKFELSAGQISGLSNFISRGKGTILMESVDAAGAASFKKVLAAMNLKPSVLGPGHPLLCKPHLFPALPQGAGEGEVQAAEGVIFSSVNYGLLWQGEARSGTPSREQIRSAVEWGENLLEYVQERLHK